MPELILTSPQLTEPIVLRDVIDEFYYPLANSKYHRVLRSIEFSFAKDGIPDPSFRLTLANGKPIDVTGLAPERGADRQTVLTARTRAFAELDHTVDPGYLRDMNAVLP